MKKAVQYLLPVLFAFVFSQQANAQITGTLTVCLGATTTLSDATPGGVWTSSAPSVAVVSLTTGIVHGMSVGTATITYTAGSTVHTAVVTVNTLPSAGSISGGSTVCIGATITLTPSVSGGVWSATNSRATVSGGVVSGVSLGLDTILYTVTTSCGSSTAMKPVTVNALPSVSTITGSSAVCVGSTITMASTTLGGSWAASNPSATVTSGGVVAGVFAGVDTIIYTITNMCGPASVLKVVTVNPLPSAGSLSGPGTVCIGSAITLSSTVTGGTWSASNATATVSGGIVTGVSSGIDTISYTVTNGCGSAITTATVAISPVPSAGSISGVSSVCEGASVTLTASIGGGTWGVSTGMASVASGVVTGIAAGVDIIEYTVSTGCGTDVATHTITVNPLPDAGTITGPDGVCNGSSITLTASGAGGTWGSDDATIADVDVSGTVGGLTPGNAVISYIVVNGCGTDTAFFPISVDVPAGPIIGPDEVCQIAIATLTNATPGGTWSSSNPLTAFVFAGTVFGVTLGTATITYTVTNGCGTTTATKDIEVISCVLNENVVAAANDELKIFPNPSNGVFMLSYSSSVNEAVSVIITNVTGEKVLELTTTANKPTEIQLNVVPGIYFLNVSTAQKNMLEKIIKD